MAVSRRFESRFRFSIGILITTTSKYFTKMAVGSNSAETATASTYPRAGIPLNGWAYSGSYSGFDLIAQNREVTANSKAANPTYPATSTAPDWDDSVWGLVPNDVKVFNGVEIGTVSGSGYHELTYNTYYKYQIGIGFWHTVNVNNTCDAQISIEYRDFDRYNYPVSGIPALVMTAWTSQTIAAGGTYLVQGYEPLEIRFDIDNMPSGEDVGIVLQDGTTKYLLLE